MSLHMKFSMVTIGTIGTIHTDVTICGDCMNVHCLSPICRLFANSLLRKVDF